MGVTGVYCPLSALTLCKLWPQVTLSSCVRHHLISHKPHPRPPPGPFPGLSCCFYHPGTALLLKSSPSPHAGAPRCLGRSRNLPQGPPAAVSQAPLQAPKPLLCSPPPTPSSSLHSWGHLALSRRQRLGNVHCEGMSLAQGHRSAPRARPCSAAFFQASPSCAPLAAPWIPGPDGRQALVRQTSGRQPAFHPQELSPHSGTNAKPCRQASFLPRALPPPVSWPLAGRPASFRSLIILLHPHNCPER